MDFNFYDKFIVCFSGGKDSIALALYLLDNGVSPNKIELWHHDIDGKGETFMDWEITPDYCKKFAEAFGMEIYFSWKEGGFKREMLRYNSLTAPTTFETPEGETITVGGTRGKLSTRLKFPQVTADLKTRWCSAYLKIDICATAIRNQDRFKQLKVCVLSGERGEESPARAKYEVLEADRSDNRKGKTYSRYVDRARPIRDWTEKQVWDIIKKYKVRSHPCYYMGFSRCSCKFCIFGNEDQFASASKVSPEISKELIRLEKYFGVTLKRKEDLESLIERGTPYKELTEDLIKLSTSVIYTESIIIEGEWKLPAGAFKKGCGPQ